MDSESKKVSNLLEAIAASNEELIEFAIKLRALSEVNEVYHRLDCRNYQTGPVLEMYVDAFHKREVGICWWLEVRWNEAEWMIDYAVQLNHDEGRDAIREFPLRTARTIEEFIVQLEGATLDLLSCTDLTALLESWAGCPGQAQSRRQRALDMAPAGTSLQGMNR